MDINALEPSWKNKLQSEFSKPYFENLVAFVKEEYTTFGCYPKESDIFAAFTHCSFNQVRVVILGQDPYHGIGQANGLCFSVKTGLPLPPSLRNIFKEIENTIGGYFPENGNLERWARQGVLLLNSTLTVRENQAASHQNKGWEKFTDAVVSLVSDRLTAVVFMLWGGSAKKKGIRVNRNKHLVLQSGHPSPLSANRGYWFGNDHFRKANAYLQSKNKFPIVW